MNAIGLRAKLPFADQRQGRHPILLGFMLLNTFTFLKNNLELQFNLESDNCHDNL